MPHYHGNLTLRADAEALCVAFVASFVPGLALDASPNVPRAWTVTYRGAPLGTVVACRHGEGYVPGLYAAEHVTRPLPLIDSLDRAALDVLQAAQHHPRFDGLVPPCQHPRCQLPF